MINGGVNAMMGQERAGRSDSQCPTRSEVAGARQCWNREFGVLGSDKTEHGGRHVSEVGQRMPL